MTVPSDNPIDVCPRCGQVWAPGAAFCDHCGEQFGAETGPAEGGTSLPGWVAHDWPRALFVAAASLLVLLAVCVTYGVGMGALSVGGGVGLAYGALAGLFLPFAVYGGEVQVFAHDGPDGGSRQLVWLADGWPLLLTAVAALITWLLLRPALRELAPDPARARAFVGKVALLSAVLVGVAGAFGDRGSVDASGVAFSDVFTGLWHSRAIVGVFVVTLLAGSLALRQVSPQPARRSASAIGAVSAARTGALACLLVVLLSGAAAMVVAGSRIDGGRERAAFAATAPLTLLGFGTSGFAIAHGGAVGAGDVSGDVDDVVQSEVEDGGLGREGDAPTIGDLDPQDVSDCYEENSSRSAASDCVDELLSDAASGSSAAGRASADASDVYREAIRISRTGTDDHHVSLFSWQVEPDDDGGRAPGTSYLLLIVPLVALVGGTLLVLRRFRPAAHGAAVGLAALLVAGYAAAAWLLTALAPLVLLASGSELSGTGLVLHLSPSLGSGFGLPLLWATVLGLGTAQAWSRHYRLPSGSRPVVAAAAAGRQGAPDVPYGGGPTPGLQAGPTGGLQAGPTGGLQAGPSGGPTAGPTPEAGYASFRKPPPDVLSDPRSTALGTCVTCAAVVSPHDSFCASCGRPVSPR